MTAWLKRARQTRTSVHNEHSQALSRRRGVLRTYRALGGVQLAAQGMLWTSLYAYDLLMGATWLAALCLLLPLLLVWAVWNAGHRGVYTKAGSWALLLLLPCLLLDAALLLSTLGALMHMLLPSYPRALFVPVTGVVCFLTVCLGRENGVAYGAGILRYILLALFVLGTVLLNADVQVQRLWPLFGPGVANVALTALTGVGSLWGIALLFFLPLDKESRTDAKLAQTNGRGMRRPMTGLWAVGLWVLICLWALWHSLVHPWQAGDTLLTGEKLMGIARHSPSMLLSQLSSILWLLLMTLALCGTVVSGEKLLRNAFQGLTRLPAVGLLLLPPMVAALCLPTTLTAVIKPLLPWRAALCLLCGLVMIVIAKKGERA